MNSLQVMILTEVEVQAYIMPEFECFHFTLQFVSKWGAKMKVARSSKNLEPGHKTAQLCMLSCKQGGSLLHSH